MRFVRLPIAIAAAALLAGTASANIITVTPDSIGQSYTVDYDGFSDGSVIPGLSGQSVFTLSGATGTSYTFDYQVTNTSTSPIDTSRLSIFGFNTDPNITSASSTGTFSQTALDSNVPSGFGTVDVCFKEAGGNNCSGGGSGGLQIGETGTGSLTLNFSTIVEQLSLSDFFVRYQSISGGDAPSSAIGRGTVSSSTGGSTGGTPVPAPGAFWLLVLGLGALGWRFGRTSRHATA